jgi:hypothetical protein
VVGKLLPRVHQRSWTDTGCPLNTFAEIPVVKKPVVAKKHTMLPVLVVLFLISYGLMSMLVIEQGNTIQHQRYLIGDLLKDSGELMGMKMNAIRQKTLAGQQKGQNHLAPPIAGATQVPQAPQSPTNKASGTHVQSGQAAPRVRAHDDKMPPRPAADMADVRRALKSI